MLLMLGLSASSVFAQGPGTSLVVGVVGTVPRLIVVHPSLELTNLDQLVRLARRSPEALGCGTSDQLSRHAVRLFERTAGARLACKHYAGAEALRSDLVAATASSRSRRGAMCFVRRPSRRCGSCCSGAIPRGRRASPGASGSSGAFVSPRTAEVLPE